MVPILSIISVSSVFVTVGRLVITVEMVRLVYVLVMVVKMVWLVVGVWADVVKVLLDGIGLPAKTRPRTTDNTVKRCILICC